MSSVEDVASLAVAQEPLSLLSPMERPSPRRHVLAAFVAGTLWLLFAWMATEEYVAQQEQAALGEARKIVAQSVSEITLGLSRNLAVYHGIPAILASDLGIREVLEAFPPGAKPSLLPYEERKSLWQANPEYAQLNQSLVATTKAIPAFSAIWVVNAAGDAVLSSNANKADSFVGTNYADREYFQAARAGLHGKQFAVGRVTRVPGLFFSAPINAGPRFLGAVVVKIDLPFLGFWVNQANAFITDPYGVIVLAHDKHLEMHALSGALVSGLSSAQRLSRYQKESIPELSISLWNPSKHPDIKLLNGQTAPVLMASQTVPDEGLTVTVMHPLPVISERTANKTGLFLASASTGLVLIAIFASTAYFVGNRRRALHYERQQKRVQYLATHDLLTGLFSRAMTEQLVAQGMALSDRTGRPMAVMFVDLDLFKKINDTMGHEAGDEVLREVAQRLRREVRAVDAVVRQGGDEFLLVLNDLEDAYDAAQIAQKLIDAISQPYLVREVRLNLSASIGIAVYPGDGDQANRMIGNADSALYQAKEGGRADYYFYLDRMNVDSMARIARVNALREAIGQSELVLYFQPQFELPSCRVVGCEALIRWQHPVEGLVQPDDFIPLAENNGLIVQIDAWVLSAACRTMYKWRQQLGIDLHVSVNISAVHFRKMGLVECVRSALSASQLPPAALELELTESAIMEDPKRAAEILTSLKALGVRLSIDDFGTGYSSLVYLKRFDTNALKIDRAFLGQAFEDSPDRSIAGAIIQMARSIDCQSIAEGVETEAQLTLLENLGCDLAQGFWLARPLSESEFYEFVGNAMDSIQNPG